MYFSLDITSLYSLEHGSPNRSPPGCVTQSEPVFVNYVFFRKPFTLFEWLGDCSSFYIRVIWITFILA